MEIWMPHAGHFICGRWCQFKMNTYVNGYIISTVGEYVPASRGEGAEFQEIGLNRKYETMVFIGTKSNFKCCKYEMASPEEIDFAGYNTADDAYEGHMKMLRKWKSKK